MYTCLLSFCSELFINHIKIITSSSTESLTNGTEPIGRLPQQLFSADSLPKKKKIDINAQVNILKLLNIDTKISLKDKSSSLK